MFLMRTSFAQKTVKARHTTLASLTNKSLPFFMFLTIISKTRHFSLFNWIRLRGLRPWWYFKPAWIICLWELLFLWWIILHFDVNVLRQIRWWANDWESPHLLPDWWRLGCCLHFLPISLERLFHDNWFINIK